MTIKTKKITIENKFHNTEINVRVPLSSFDNFGDVTLTKSQSKRVEKALCGISDCCCFNRHTHAEGFDYIQEDQDGQIELCQMG
jgi:hypothetical protein